MANESKHIFMLGPWPYAIFFRANKMADTEDTVDVSCFYILILDQVNTCLATLLYTGLCQFNNIILIYQRAHP